MNALPDRRGQGNMDGEPLMTISTTDLRAGLRSRKAFLANDRTGRVAELERGIREAEIELAWRERLLAAEAKRRPAQAEGDPWAAAVANMPFRVVAERKVRQTGTLVLVIDNRGGRFDSDDPNGWFNLCVDHGGVCSHETRALAMAFMPVPREWCPTCQEDE